MAVVECLCPPTAGGVRHPDGDTVTLSPKLEFRALSTIRYAFIMLKRENPNTSTAETLAMLAETYITVGVESWTVLDAKGKPVEVSSEAVRDIILANYTAATAVGDEADELYSEVVVRDVITPLVQTASPSSPPSPIKPSTSAKNSSSPLPQKPSKRSSTITSQMDGIATTT